MNSQSEETSTEIRQVSNQLTEMAAVDIQLVVSKEGENSLNQQGLTLEAENTSTTVVEEEKELNLQPTHMATVQGAVVTEEEAENNLKQKLSETEKLLKRTTRLLEKSQKYNEELRAQIEQLSTELHTYRNAAQSRTEAGCQADDRDIAEACGDKPFPDWGPSGDSAQQWEGGCESGTSIAESLKAAAQEEVWQQAGFIHDSGSGLYYHCNSGYYYDSARSLYYDPSSTSYFYYDETDQSYKFHSYATGEQQGETTSQQGETTSQPLEDNGTGETTDVSQNSSSTLVENRRNREKPHKQKHKAKIKKGAIHKARRRTKSRNQRRRSRGHKNQDTSKTGAEKGMTSVEDWDKREEKKKVGQKEGADVHEAMEFDESSDSLATGESEMESEPESGELTDQSSSSSSSEDEDDKRYDLCADPMHYDLSSARVETEPEVAVNYPPCIRVVVQSSDVVAVGTFFLVTCPGGFVGRDGGSRHAIQIPDINVSKVHAEIRYDSDNSCYTVTDLGSQNGTFINDLRISQSKEHSAPIPLSHGDILGVAGTRMLLHIHHGCDTCDLCEPGQVLAALKAQNTICNDHVVLSKSERKKQARQQLKEIKKKYGLVNSAYVDNMEAIKNPEYADKAEMRRRYVGSEHPSHQKPHQPPASVHRPISSENKGHRMLAKMGWKEGSGLGKNSAGRAEPVEVELRAQQTAGLGSTASISVSLDNVQSAPRMRRIVQMQKRYHCLEQSSTSNQPESGALDDKDGYTEKDALDHNAHCAQRDACDQNGGKTSAAEGDGVGSLGNSGKRTPRSVAISGGGKDCQTGGGECQNARGSSLKVGQIKWIQGQTQNPT